MTHEIKAGHCPVCGGKTEYSHQDDYYADNRHQDPYVYVCRKCKAEVAHIHRDVLDKMKFLKREPDRTPIGKVQTFHAPDYEALWREAVGLLSKCRQHFSDDNNCLATLAAAKRLNNFDDDMAAISKGAQDE